MRVGSDIGAICRKCGDVWHVVVAVVNGRIAKVECKQCGARHRFQRPEGGVRESARPASLRGRSGSGHGKRPAPVVAADPSRPPRAYRPSEHYRAGDRVRHESFGEGVVQSVAGPHKVHVLFTSGAKTLIHGRGGE